MKKKNILLALFLAFGAVECTQSPRGLRVPHHKFTAEDDQSLRELVAANGTDWKTIAASMPGRNVRQVRERWINYLAPDVNIEPYTPAEDALLLEKHRELGPKWFKIASFFSGRTDISVKNRWNTLSRRGERERKPAKPIVAVEPQRRDQTTQAQLDADADAVAWTYLNGFTDFEPANSARTEILMGWW